MLAGERYGIPVVGTMAHSFVQVHDDEMTAFENFARARPDGVILLIDTYDTEAGARKVVQLAPKLKADGIAIRGVRIDSGDLAAMAKKVRAILDAGGLKDVIILVSGGINEDVLQTMIADKAPIDGYGIGVNLDASIDAPVARLRLQAPGIRRHAAAQALGGQGHLAGTQAGVAHLRRRQSACAEDVLSLESDNQRGETLIAPAMRAGKRVAPAPTLAQISERAVRELAALPEPLASSKPAPNIP